jgi:hypothetical protein
MQAHRDLKAVTEIWRRGRFVPGPSILREASVPFVFPC